MSSSDLSQLIPPTGEFAHQCVRVRCSTDAPLFALYHSDDASESVVEFGEGLSKHVRIPEDLWREGFTLATRSWRGVGGWSLCWTDT